MNCEWTALTYGSRCLRCGTMLKRDYETAPVSACKVRVQPQLQQPTGLGDQVESLLSSFGITKDRYGKVRELFGLPSTCGCVDRQKALNEWGEKVSSWWRGFGRERVE